MQGHGRKAKNRNTEVTTEEQLGITKHFLSAAAVTGSTREAGPWGGHTAPFWGQAPSRGDPLGSRIQEQGKGRGIHPSTPSSQQPRADGWHGDQTTLEPHEEQTLRSRFRPSLISHLSVLHHLPFPGSASTSLHTPVLPLPRRSSPETHLHPRPYLSWHLLGCLQRWGKCADLGTLIFFPGHPTRIFVPMPALTYLHSQQGTIIQLCFTIYTIVHLI